MNSFTSSGIYPVDRSVISEDQLKTALTFDTEIEKKSTSTSDGQKKTQTVDSNTIDEQVFNAYASVLKTPIRQKYLRRQEEGYDIEGASPGYDTYLLLKSKIKSSKVPTLTETPVSSVTPVSAPNENPAPIDAPTPTEDPAPTGLQLLSHVATCHI